MEKIKVPGYGVDGCYLELAEDVEIREESGDPESSGEEWKPSRWELWDGDDLIWCVDYSGVANSWAADPREDARRTIEWFAAIYSLGKSNAQKPNTVPK